MSLSLTAIGAGINIVGGLAGLIGALQGPDELLPQNMNKEQTAELLRQTTDAIARYQAGQEGALRDLENLSGQIGQFQSQMEQVRRDVEGIQAPTENDAYRTFLNRVPEYQRIAKEVALEATSPYGDQREIAQRRAQEAARIATASAAASGNLYSGATVGAAAGAAGDALGNYEQALAQQYGQAYTGQAGQLIGQGQQLSRQDLQGVYQNEIGKAQALLSSLQAQGAMTGQQMQGALGQAQLFGDSLNQARNTQAQLMGPQFATPNFIPNQATGLGSALAGLGAGITGFGQTLQANPASSKTAQDVANKGAGAPVGAPPSGGYSMGPAPGTAPQSYVYQQPPMPYDPTAYQIPQQYAPGNFSYGQINPFALQDYKPSRYYYGGR